MVYEIKTAEDQQLVDRLAEGRDVCVRLSHGEVLSEWFPRESKRSDSHQISFGLTRNRITIDGSPARLIGDNNVFGDANPKACGDRMLRAVSKASGVILPALDRWRFTRVDLTQNYDCESRGNVRIALESLGKVAGGHLKASTFNETVYWNRASELWKAKAYAKGPHLAFMCKRGKAAATAEELKLSDQMLRIELTLANTLIKRLRLNWSTLTEEFCMDLFKEHVGKLIPEHGVDLTSEQQLTDILIEKFGARKARSMMGTWGLIKVLGLAAVKSQINRATFFRHQSDFKSVGLTIGDLAEGKILPFRPRSIIARPVDSWEQLRRAA